MFNFFKKKNKFTIEYYPESDRYYPKHNDNYLNQSWCTGIVEHEWYFPVADYGKTEDEAKEYIKLFKEQQLKENVKEISYDAKN